MYALRRLLLSTVYSFLVPPVVSKVTYTELAKWVTNEQVATGDLVRVSFGSLDNIQAGSGFKKIGSTKVLTGEIVISKGALQLDKDLNSQAKVKKVNIKVNQALRISGVKVNSAVVPPATKSQHLIGHAIDCNIVDGSNWNNSSTFKQKKETQNVKDIIKTLKDSGFRWGGNFSKADSPHFANKLSSTSFAYDAKFYLNQRTISENQDIKKEVI